MEVFPYCPNVHSPQLPPLSCHPWPSFSSSNHVASVTATIAFEYLPMRRQSAIIVYLTRLFRPDMFQNRMVLVFAKACLPGWKLTGTLLRIKSLRFWDKHTNLSINTHCGCPAIQTASLVILRCAACQLCMASISLLSRTKSEELLFLTHTNSSFNIWNRMVIQ